MSLENERVDAPKADAGLPMSPKWDPEKLEAEKKALRELETLPLGKRAGGYIKRTGPGLLQSAMTLGAGSATASVVAGASFGYKLLWVQPLAMFFGVMMLAALSNIVLTRGERPYRSFGREVWKPLVFLWALGTILSSVIWHFPQYALLAGAGRDLFSSLGADFSLPVGADGVPVVPAWIHGLSNVLSPLGFKVSTNINTAGYFASFVVGAFVLIMNIIVVFNYGKGSKGVKLYERFLRSMIALVIIFFAIVCVMNFNKINWTELFKGFVGYYGFPKNADGAVEGATYLQVLGMLGAAVGINMTFLYPYSLLAKGWGEEHKKLARWDLGMTMFIPFTIVTSLIIVAMTVTGVYTGGDAVNQEITPLAAAKAFGGLPFGDAIFCLGLMGMCGGAVSVHMVACGFTMCEMLGLDMTQKRFRLFALTPCIGYLGVVISLPMWFPVVASAVCFTMLPVAYFLFLYLNNKRSYIGDAVGKGWKRWLFNALLVAALIFASIGSAKSLKSSVYDKIFPAPAQENVDEKPLVEDAQVAEASGEVDELETNDASESASTNDSDLK